MSTPPNSKTATSGCCGEKAEVRSAGPRGRGLFATAAIPRASIIAVAAGRIIPASAIQDFELPYHAFQIETNLFVAPLDTADYGGLFCVNHSCEPNAGIRGHIALTALRDIRAGEEICYDYAMTDSEADGVPPYHLECLCRTARCRGAVTDSDWRLEALQRAYEGHFSLYLEERIRREYPRVRGLKA
jgi:SET domain-containing protein